MSHLNRWGPDTPAARHAAWASQQTLFLPHSNTIRNQIGPTTVTNFHKTPRDSAWSKASLFQEVPLNQKRPKFQGFKMVQVVFLPLTCSKTTPMHRTYIGSSIVQYHICRCSMKLLPYQLSAPQVEGPNFSQKNLRKCLFSFQKKLLSIFWVQKSHHFCWSIKIWEKKKQRKPKGTTSQWWYLIVCRWRQGLAWSEPR